MELFALLKTHPHYELFLAAGRPKEVGEMEWALVRASVWSDWVRPRHNDARSPTVVWFHCGEEHYTTIPFIDPKDEAAFANKTLVPPDQTDVLCGLKHWCNILRIRTASPEDKAVAICWIFHLVGDIHQPLHNTSYFSSEPGFTRGDQGGTSLASRSTAGRGNCTPSGTTCWAKTPITPTTRRNISRRFSAMP